MASLEELPSIKNAKNMKGQSLRKLPVKMDEIAINNVK
jgi:hypothetical protein